MNSSLGHNVMSSMKEFINYRLLKDYSAYTNRSVTLYRYSDSKFTGKYVYGSSYPSFVYNSGVSGPTICSGVYNSGFNPKGTGLFVDYSQGRVISNSAITGTVTANVAVPNFSIFVTTYSDYKLVAETDYSTQPFNVSPTGYRTPYSYNLPAIFLRLKDTSNEEISFGGNEWTTYDIKVIALAKSNYELTLIADAIRDLDGRNIPLLTGTPLNEYGDLKNGWNYANEISNPSSYGMIGDASFGFFENDSFAASNPSLEVGLGNISLQIQRNPRQLFP